MREKWGDGRLLTLHQRSAKPSIHGVTSMLEANAPCATANSAPFKRSKAPQTPLTIPAGHVLFRLLCHSSRIGGVIGKSGTIVKQLQQDTGAKIRVEESPPGADERIIVVVGSSSVNKKIAFKASKEEEEGGGVNNEVTEVSAAQEAVIRVFERILDVAAETDGVSVAPGGVVSCRLLTDPFQAGSVIGKGGKVVEKIRRDTGCKIRVLNAEKLPACALPKDEMIEIEGDILAVKKALVTVSRCLQDCIAVDRAKMSGSQPLGAMPQDTIPDLHVDLSQRSSVLPPMPAISATYASVGPSLSMECGRFPGLDSRLPQQEVVFRLLCSSDRVGGVIGKGGTIVKALQDETGASINVGAPVAQCDERLITISAMENPESQHSPAQNAIVLVFNRAIEAAYENGLDSNSSKGSLVSARIVVPSKQVGCLLGKGGTIISEMRKATGTGIWIIGHDQVPKCASENDDVVQIRGELVNVQDALYTVTGRLRNNLFSNRISTGAGTRGSSSVITPISPYGSARDCSTLGLRTSFGVCHNFNRHANLTQSMDHLGLTHNYDHPPSSRLWASQETLGGVNPSSTMNVGRGLTNVKSGPEFGSGSRTPIVTNTTVQILVPEDAIGSVYGENGGNLDRLRQISGAKVVVHERRPGTTERNVVISGTPDQTQAAQSLLQAFIFTGPS